MGRAIVKLIRAGWTGVLRIGSRRLVAFNQSVPARKFSETHANVRLKTTHSKQWLCNVMYSPLGINNPAPSGKWKLFSVRICFFFYDLSFFVSWLFHSSQLIFLPSTTMKPLKYLETTQVLLDFHLCKFSAADAAWQPLSPCHRPQPRLLRRSVPSDFLISQKSQHYYLYLWPPTTITFPQNMREPGNLRNTKSWTCGRLFVLFSVL